jgi:hypothetical protein
MRRFGFTRGSCFGWQGVVPFRGSNRVLDVTLEDDRPDLVTLVFEPIRRVEDPAAPSDESEVEALLEWGAAQGAPHQAVIDVGRGTTLAISASRIIATVRNIGAGQANASEMQLRASASLGGASASAAPQRAVRIGAIGAGGVAGPAMLPAFARRVSVWRVPQELLALEFRGGAGHSIGQTIWPLGQELVANVPPGADRFVIANPGRSDIAHARVVFELAL